MYPRKLPVRNLLFRPCLAFAVSMLFASFEAGLAQDGFRRFEGKYIELITDLPADPEVDLELQELPKAFDAAVPIWCEFFEVSPDDVASWKATACLMLDKQRFRSAGLIPAGVPEFPYGFQYGDQLFVTEQPSAYYRRHLLIHEGTHWFMSRQFGANAPPWIMEGMAEYFGTHRWEYSQGELFAPIIPVQKKEVPYWGRITRIQKDLETGKAPSLEQVMQYDNTAHRRPEAYAWSWAAVVFMLNHPDTREAYLDMLNQPMQPDPIQTRWLFQRLRSRWPAIRESWNAFVSDLEYGWTPEPGMLQVSPQPRKLGSQEIQLTLSTQESWQASGFYVLEGTKLQVRAKGKFRVAETSAPWISTADGVSLEYYRGQPLGRLMLGFAMPRNGTSKTEKLTIVPLGMESETVAPLSGELHFRINESPGALQDNQGDLQIELKLLSSP
ncbi:MAG: DUF1570 domain-containing protein [Planctomycetota bacterium]